MAQGMNPLRDHESVVGRKISGHGKEAGYNRADDKLDLANRERRPRLYDCSDTIGHPLITGDGFRQFGDCAVIFCMGKDRLTPDKQEVSA